MAHLHVLAHIRVLADVMHGVDIDVAERPQEQASSLRGWAARSRHVGIDVDVESEVSPRSMCIQD